FNSQAPPPAWTLVQEGQKVLPAPAPAPAPKEPSLAEAIREARAAMDGLAGKALANSQEHADVLRDATAPLEVARVDLGQKRSSTDPKLAKPRPGMTTGLQTIAATARRGISFMLQETPPLQPGKKDGA